LATLAAVTLVAMGSAFGMGNLRDENTSASVLGSFGAANSAAGVTLAASTGTATTTGDLLVATIRTRVVTAKAATVVSVTDSAGNPWVLAKGTNLVQGAESDGEIWYAANANSVTAVTVTVSASATVAFTVLDIAGASTVNPLDGVAVAGGTGTSPSVGPTASTTQASEIVVADVGWNGTETLSGPTAGYTTSPPVREQATVKSLASGEQAAWQILSATDPQSYAAELTSSVVWTANIATFDLSGAPPTPTPSPTATPTPTITPSPTAGPETAVTYWGTWFSASGSSPTVKSPATVEVPGAVAQISTSNSTDYALLTNGQVWAWGYGDAGQLGDGGTANSFTVPVQVVFPGNVTIAKLASDAMPYNAAIAIDSSGNVWGWGNNLTGALCAPKSSGYLEPTKLPAPLTNVSMAAGASDFALYDAGGSLYSCGINTYGQLGTGNTKNSFAPAAVSGMQNKDIVTLVASSVDGGALLADGTYYNWGDDPEGQLGQGVFGVSSDVPLVVTFPDASGVAQVAAGGDNASNGSTLVKLSDGTYYAWGADAYSQLGDGGTTNEPSPIGVTPPGGNSYTLVALSGETGYGVTLGGAVYSWGRNAKGEIGNAGTTNQPVPVMVQSGVTQISATAQDVDTLPS
jgi:alpha-tubulin suppressor-like RCC1 family protein